MNKKEKKGAALNSTLHIVESEESKARATSDLNYPGVTVEQARAVLEPDLGNKNNIKNNEPKNE